MKKLLLFLSTCLILVIIITAKDGTEVPVQQTPAQRLYNSIITYASLYDIPIHVAFNIARIETGYLGPHHTNYNHKQKSSSQIHSHAVALLQISQNQKSKQNQIQTLRDLSADSGLRDQNAVRLI